VLTLLLLLDLLGEEDAHAGLVILHFLLASLLELALTHFFLFFVALDHVVLEVLSGLHLLEHTVGHLVHEFLGASLTRLHLADTIRLHLILHLGVLLLGTKVVEALLLFLRSHSVLLLFIFLEHTVQIFALLSPLLHLHLSLLFHFVAEASDLLLLLHKLSLIRISLSSALLSKLEVARVLVIHDLLHDLRLSLLFALLEQLIVLCSHLMVHAIFVMQISILVVLVFDLRGKLLPDESLPLHVTNHCLLLLLKVQQCVEFLDCSPLIVFIYFTVCLSWWRFARRGNRGYIKVVSQIESHKV